MQTRPFPVSLSLFAMVALVSPVLVFPALAQLPDVETIIFEETFDDPFFVNNPNWFTQDPVSISSGTLTMAGGYVISTNSYQAVPVVIEFQGFAVEQIDGVDTYATVFVSQVGQDSGHSYTVTRTSDPSPFVRSFDTAQGGGQLEASAALDTTPHDVAFVLSADTIELYIDGSLSSSAPVSTNYDFRVAFLALPNVTLSLDGVRIYEGSQDNPVSRVAEPGTTTPMDFGTTVGMTADVTLNDSTYSALTVEQVPALPPNTPQATVLGDQYWEVSGLQGSDSSLRMTHEFDESEAMSQGLTPSNLAAYQSLDGGTNWDDIGGTVTLAGANSEIEFDASTDDSLYTISEHSSTARVLNWRLVE
ncbi:MAG: hypothetical protein RLY93_03690 [Sumerlaeia bacterium]